MPALERMLSQLRSWLSSWRTRRTEDLLIERQFIVCVTENGLSVAYPTGEIQAINWSDVGRILVETNDSGPYGADVWWIIEGKGSECSFPLGASGEDVALEEIRLRFPTFEVQGMNSIANARFICWDRNHAL